jgi:dihydroorotate dehydrogenase
MPDWSYQTILRPMLFRLPPASARNLSVWAMGTLARSPLGPLVIDFMGHMRPDPRLSRGRMGLSFPSAVGLGAGIDSAGMSTPALARFGLGFLELGPVTARAQRQGRVGRRPGGEEIEAPETLDNPGAQASLFYTNPAVFPAPGPNNCQHCAMSCMR